jgi:hypothetical protein
VSLPRQRGLTEQAATTAVDQACRMLRLPTIRSQCPDLAETASREQMSYLGFLAELLLAECDDRARRRSERRTARSNSCVMPGPQLSRSSALSAPRHADEGFSGLDDILDPLDQDLLPELGNHGLSQRRVEATATVPWNWRAARAPPKLIRKLIRRVREPDVRSLPHIPPNTDAARRAPPASRRRNGDGGGRRDRRLAVCATAVRGSARPRGIGPGTGGAGAGRVGATRPGGRGHRGSPHGGAAGRAPARVPVPADLPATQSPATAGRSTSP